MLRKLQLPSRFAFMVPGDCDRGNVGIIRSPVRASILPDPTPLPGADEASAGDRTSAILRRLTRRWRPSRDMVYAAVYWKNRKNGIPNDFKALVEIYGFPPRVLTIKHCGLTYARQRL
jgi:hypothetical protein